MLAPQRVCTEYVIFKIDGAARLEFIKGQYLRMISRICRLLMFFAFPPEKFIILRVNARRNENLKKLPYRFKGRNTKNIRQKYKG